jgi:hypothetical protein
MTARRPIVGGVALLALTLALPWVHFGDTEMLGDVRHYHRFAEAILDGRLPYRDFFVEYPPGALPMFVLPELAGHAVTAYGTFFQWLVVALTAATIAAVSSTVAAVGGSRRRALAAAAFVAVTPALLGSVYVRRYDIWAATLSAFAVLAAVRRRDNWALALLGAAAAAKLYPVVLLPLLLARVLRDGGRPRFVRAVGAFAGTFVVIVGPFLAVAPGGVEFSFRTQVTRRLQVESLGGAFLLSAHQLDLYAPRVYEGLSSELLGSLPRLGGLLQTIVLVAALFWIWRAFYRSAHTDEVLLLAAAAAAAVTVTFNKVLSPQYLIWLAPLVAQLGRRTGTVARALLATAMVLTLAYFPSRFHDLRHLGSSAWIVLARNAVLVALVVFLLWALRRAVRSERAYEVQPPVAPL